MEIKRKLQTLDKIGSMEVLPTFPVPGVFASPHSLMYTLSSVRNDVPFTKGENHCEIFFLQLLKFQMPR